MKIELDPYHAALIMKHLQEFIDDEAETYSESTLLNAREEFKKQYLMNAADEEIDEIYFNIELNTLIGNFPKS